MAKRFIDTLLFSDEWFSELPIDGKLLFIYYITSCDHAGVLKFNKRLVEFQTGIKNVERVMEGLCNRIIRVGEGLYFCPKFLQYQYPNFPNSRVPAQASAIKILQDLNLMDLQENFLNLNKGYGTLTEPLQKGYGYGYDNGNENGYKEKGVKGGKTFVPDYSTFKPEFQEAIKLWFDYKKEKGKLIKGQIELSRVEKKLENLSKEFSITAMAIVEHSISNGYAGLFAPSKTTNNNHEQPKQPARRGYERRGGSDYD